MRPQTIQIFLPDGSPTSIREAELTNRLVKAILFPRNKIQEVAQREMVHYTGVYFLFGTTEEGAKPIVYIGEGEDCFKRIQSHNRNKDFWTHCVVVTTKTNEYTKTDGKFLEHYCLDKANEIGRYKTDNDTGSKKPSIPEGREYDLLDNFETLKILLATLGYPIFEDKNQGGAKKDMFYCKGKAAKAEGVYGPHLALYEAIGEVHESILGKKLPLNGAGVGGAALADLGLPIDLLRGFALLARTAGLVGHLAEEHENPIGPDVYYSVDRNAVYEG